MKILRFNDDRIGVIKDGNMVVDVSDSVSARKAKGPQRVMEEIIEGWRKYRRRFEKILAEQSSVPLDSVQLRCPLPRPSKGDCLSVQFPLAFLKMPRAPRSRGIPWRKRCCWSR